MPVGTVLGPVGGVGVGDETVGGVVVAHRRAASRSSVTVSRAAVRLGHSDRGPDPGLVVQRQSGHR